MKFADQTIRRTNQNATQVDDVVGPSLWLPSNSELNIKSPPVKVLEDRRVSLNLFSVLLSKQLNHKGVKEQKSPANLFSTLVSKQLNRKVSESRKISLTCLLHQHQKIED